MIVCTYDFSLFLIILPILPFIGTATLMYMPRLLYRTLRISYVVLSHGCSIRTDVLLCW